jgi:hypothetical protein
VQDFSADERSLLRFTVDTGVIFSMVAILFMFERVRVMAVEAQTRDGPQRRHRWAGARRAVGAVRAVKARDLHRPPRA